MIIEVDKYKKKIKGYDPAHSELFHSESGKLADKDFYKHVVSKKIDTVVFLAGGTASGKTEFASLYLQDKNLLVYDGTMKSVKGFEIKYKKIKKLKHIKKIRVVLIIPNNIYDSLAVFVERPRKMPIDTFIETQINSRKSILKILENDFDVELEIYLSAYTKRGLTYVPFSYVNKEILQVFIKTVEFDLITHPNEEIRKIIDMYI